MLEPPPGRFSTTNCWPSCPESHGPMSRARMSGKPPGAVAATMRTGRVGEACAGAMRDKAGSAAAPAARCKNVRRGSFSLNLPPFTSFDHLVGDGQHPWWKAEAECLRGVQVDHELELSRSHDRQVRGLRTLEDAANIDTRQPICLGDARSVAHQTAGFGKLTLEIGRKHPMVCRQRNELYAAVVGQRAGADQQRIHRI